MPRLPEVPHCRVNAGDTPVRPSLADSEEEKVKEFGEYLVSESLLHFDDTHKTVLTFCTKYELLLFMHQQKQITCTIRTLFP